MRDWALELENRVRFIREAMEESGAKGLVFGNSGGKDSALAGILCKRACDDTVGVILPCQAKRNYGEDAEDGRALAKQYGIETRVVDLGEVKAALVNTLAAATSLNEQARTNIAPRLRMTALYAVAAAEGRLVVGTGNRCERHMGYFTKWGDGAFDINPIGDLLVSEIYDFLAYLGAPESIIKKPPSAGLFEGQTDEDDMGVTYAAIERYLTTGEASDADRATIDRYHRASGHKRRPARIYGE